MATESVDELDEVLRLYQAWLNKTEPGNFWEQVPEAKKLLDAYIARECARKVLEIIGEDEDLNAPAETYGKDDQSLGDNPYPNPNLQYIVRRATRNVFRAELRAAIQEVGGAK